MIGCFTKRKAEAVQRCEALLAHDALKAIDAAFADDTALTIELTKTLEETADFLACLRETPDAFFDMPAMLHARLGGPVAPVPSAPLGRWMRAPDDR